MTNAKNVIDHSPIQKIRQLEEQSKKSLLPQLVVLFSKQGFKAIHEIRNQLKTKDYKKVILICHDFKTSAANLGASELEETVEFLARHCETIDESQLHLKIQAMEENFEFALEELKKIASLQ
jgi:HPt (histidine-containing phosphotransfer) domain-containing protein